MITVRGAGAELHAPAQPVERVAPGIDRRAHRHRHDLRHPDRRHRPFGRRVAGARRHGGRLRGEGGLADRFAIGEGVEAGNPCYLALLAALAVGIAGGAAQGFIITRFSVPPFVVTLGGLTIFRGLTLLLSGGGPISAFQPDYTWWGQGRVDLWFIADVPVPAVIFVLAALVAHIVLRYTRFGQHVFATGANRVAATLNGVPTQRIIFLVYVIVGFTCGLAAFLLSARLSSAEAVAGDRSSSSPSSPRS